MSSVQPGKPVAVMGPHGERLSMATIPARNTSRWVPARKAQVVYAVNGGLLSVDEALARYGLSREEFVSWQRLVERAGLPGLRVTQIKNYRRSSDKQLSS